VRFTIHYKDGKPFESEEDLIKEGGTWKIASNNYLQAAMEREFPLGILEDGKNREPKPDPKPPEFRLGILEGGKDHAAKPDPKPPVPKPSGLVRINAFLGISPDFKVCAVSDAGGVKIVDLETGKPLTSPMWDRDWGSPQAAAFSKDNISVVADGFGSGQAVKVFSSQTGELTQNIRGEINDAAFSRDGRYLALVEFQRIDERHLVLRDVAGKKTVADVRIGDKMGSAKSLSIAEKLAATYAPRAEEVCIVEFETGTVVKRLKAKEFLGEKPKQFGLGDRLPMALSMKGDLMACGTADDVILYDLKVGKVLHTLEGHLDFVVALAFHPSGEFLASTAMDKTIRFWNLKDGKEINVVKNLPALTSELIFSADGKRMAVVYRKADFSDGRKAEIRSVELK
jgi:WD40 repeat protein